MPESLALADGSVLTFRGEPPQIPPHHGDRVEIYGTWNGRSYNARLIVTEVKIDDEGVLTWSAVPEPA